jgi:hypothetical protein
VKTRFQNLLFKFNLYRYTLGYDPTATDLAALKERAAAAMPKLMAKDQEALREALLRLGDTDSTPVEA